MDDIKIMEASNSNSESDVSQLESLERTIAPEMFDTSVDLFKDNQINEFQDTTSITSTFDEDNTSVNDISVESCNTFTGMSNLNIVDSTSAAYSGPECYEDSPMSIFSDIVSLSTMPEISYNDQGFLVNGDPVDVCDCLRENCIGCHFPCQVCRSGKCGTECRQNRKWLYEYAEVEGTDILHRNKHLDSARKCT